MVIGILLLSCTGELEPRAGGDATGVSPSDTSSTPTTMDSAPPSTGDTAVPLDCAAPLPLGPLDVETLPIQTEEDFDFDGEGRLIAQSSASLVGYRIDGTIDVLAANIGLDAAGIRVLPSEDYIAAQPVTGVVKLIDASTGGVSNALTALKFPNGLEVDRDGLAYVGEFLFNGGLRVFDPYTGDQQILIDGMPINAVALSPDEQVLYVSTHGYGIATFTGILAMDRDPATGEWLPELRTVIETGSLMQGLVTDLCSNLYAVESNSGNVYRYNIADESVDLLVELDQSGGLFSSARFSLGLGGFSQTSLYVTDRTRIYVLDVGIAGRHVLHE